MIVALYTCDWCREEARSHGAAFLPAGWISVDQGVGFNPGAGMGTAALPKEVDIYIRGQTFCSVRHLGAWTADNLAKMGPR